MANLKDTALAYEPQQIHNVADLDEVSVDVEVYDATKKNVEGEEFTYQFVKINDKEYRIPSSVLEEIQKILKLKPTVTKVKVTKSGSGMATRYKVEALD